MNRNSESEVKTNRRVWMTATALIFIGGHFVPYLPIGKGKATLWDIYRGLADRNVWRSENINSGASGELVTLVLVPLFTLLLLSRAIGWLLRFPIGRLFRSVRRDTA